MHVHSRSFFIFAAFLLKIPSFSKTLLLFMTKCFPLPFLLKRLRSGVCCRAHQENDPPQMRRIISYYDSKHYLHQQHVDRRAAENADQGIAFPCVQHDDAARRDQLRQTVWRGREADVLEAIDDQHADEGRRQDFSQIRDIGRRVPAEDQKW